MSEGGLNQVGNPILFRMQELTIDILVDTGIESLDMSSGGSVEKSRNSGWTQNRHRGKKVSQLLAMREERWRNARDQSDLDIRGVTHGWARDGLIEISILQSIDLHRARHVERSKQNHNRLC
jgi:hypothetical protein